MKTHSKSRGGCLNCKRRKVKCDETKPACNNCQRFRLPCAFHGAAAHVPTPAQRHDVHVALKGRRGRGRPRRDWAAVSAQAAASSTSVLSSTASPSTASPSPPSPLDVADLELLHHFTTCTAQSLAGSDADDDPIARFWSRNVPRLAFDHHYVLHLLLAVAGYHLAHLRGRHGTRPYLSLAERHAAAGLAGFSGALPGLGNDSCQALYVSAMLVCYCTFAAGPTGPADVLVCHLDHSAAWLPLIKGVRLINETVDSAALFSGLLAPLGPSDAREAEGAKFARDGFPRVDWETPLDDLRDVVASTAGDDVDVCLDALRSLTAIYAAVYGRGVDGAYDGPQDCQFVFGWLYRIQDGFVASLRSRNSAALVLVAYFAVLLRTMDDCWFVRGWCSHIVESVSSKVTGREYAACLRWPRERAGPRG